MAGWRPPRRVGRNVVRQADAVGIGVRIPVGSLDLVADLLSPAVPADRVTSQTSFVTLYATVGDDLLDGRHVRHRWVNVISDPPPGVPADDAIGGLAYIGAPGSQIGRMWGRAGLPVVPGRLWLSIDREWRTARVVIRTAAGRVRADITFEPVGVPWSFRPQHYYLLDPARPILYTGDEDGVSHDGVAMVTIEGIRRSATLAADASVDLEVGWDYAFEPIPGSARRRLPEPA